MHVYRDRSGCTARGTLVWSVTFGRWLGHLTIGWCRPAYLIIGPDSRATALGLRDSVWCWRVGKTGLARSVEAY